jgi:hypothetical protein
VDCGLEHAGPRGAVRWYYIRAPIFIIVAGTSARRVVREGIFYAAILIAIIVKVCGWLNVDILLVITTKVGDIFRKWFCLMLRVLVV